MYLACTRLNLACALSIVSQFMHNLREQHLKAVLHILRYLKFALGKGIFPKKNENYLSAEACFDVD